MNIKKIINPKFNTKASVGKVLILSIIFFVVGLSITKIPFVELEDMVVKFFMNLISVELILGGYISINFLVNYKDKRGLVIGGICNFTALVILITFYTEDIKNFIQMVAVLAVIVLIGYSLRRFYVTFMTFAVYQLVSIFIIFIIMMYCPKITNFFKSIEGTLYILMLISFTLYLSFGVFLNNIIYTIFVSKKDEKITYNEMRQHLLYIGCMVFILFNIYSFSTEKVDMLYSVLNTSFITFGAMLGLNNVFNFKAVREFWEEKDKEIE